MASYVFPKLFHSDANEATYALMYVVSDYAGKLHAGNFPFMSGGVRSEVPENIVFGTSCHHEPPLPTTWPPSPPCPAHPENREVRKSTKTGTGFSLFPRFAEIQLFPSSRDAGWIGGGGSRNARIL